MSDNPQDQPDQTAAGDEPTTAEEQHARAHAAADEANASPQSDWTGRPDPDETVSLGPDAEPHPEGAVQSEAGQFDQEPREG